MKRFCLFLLVFVLIIPFSVSLSASASVFGDVNGDGGVNNLDATRILMYDADIIDFDGEIYAIADVNFDNSVDTLDATIILRYDAGLIDTICKHINTKVINLVDATVNTDGYSGDVFCNDCQKVISGGIILEKFDYLPQPVTYLTYTKDNGSKLTLPSGVDVLQYTLKRANKTAESQLPDIEAEIFTLINEERVKAGVAPLEKQENAYYFSSIRAKECVESFSHTRPDGRGCFSVFDDHDVFYRSVGENLFCCGGYSLSDIAELSVESWMNSDGHRANILNSKFKTSTVAIVYIEETRDFYAVQLFMA